ETAALGVRTFVVGSEHSPADLAHIAGNTGPVRWANPSIYAALVPAGSYDDWRREAFSLPTADQRTWRPHADPDDYDWCTISSPCRKGDTTMKAGAATVAQSQDGMLKVIQQSQEALVGGIRSWAGLARPFVANGTGFPFATLLPLGEMVERYFDFGDQLLATQR